MFPAVPLRKGRLAGHRRHVGTDGGRTGRPAADRHPQRRSEAELAGTDAHGDADGGDLVALLDGGWDVRITTAPAGRCLVYLHRHDGERLRALGGTPAEALRNARELAGPASDDPEGGR